MELEKRDYILCECALDELKSFMETHIEPTYTINITQLPGICMTMVRAEDSVEYQEFYLGEALTTDCEVEINNVAGYGICLGDEPERAYCIAVFDALLSGNDPLTDQMNAFLTTQHALIKEKEKVEFNRILSTKVDFKLMDQL